MTNSTRLINMSTGGLFDIEIKSLDVNRSETVLTAPTDCIGMEILPSSGCTGCLNELVQGDGPSIRAGHKINCLSMFIQGYIAFRDATADKVREMPKVSIAPV